jgi:hypothetical protein
MADEKTPINWYAVVTTASHYIQPYYECFELLTDPRLLPFEQDGKNLGKLTYSGFSGYADYEGVLKEARELISVLTGTLRIRQGPGPLSIVNIVGIFDDGREESFRHTVGPGSSAGVSRCSSGSQAPNHGRPLSSLWWNTSSAQATRS